MKHIEIAVSKRIKKWSVHFFKQEDEARTKKRNAFLQKVLPKDVYSEWVKKSTPLKEKIWELEIKKDNLYSGTLKSTGLDEEQRTREALKLEDKIEDLKFKLEKLSDSLVSDNLSEAQYDAYIDTM